MSTSDASSDPTPSAKPQSDRARSPRVATPAKPAADAPAADAKAAAADGNAAATPAAAAAATPADEPTGPVRIISISEDGKRFSLEAENLKLVLDRVEKINANRVAIVSVVGAFRTGKSFILDLFLRYLQHSDGSAEPSKPGQVPDWVTKGGPTLLEGNASLADKRPGFLWRPGKERTTTGIWMYSVPYVRTLPDTKEKIGIILMDTQGMFDLQTSKELTAAIFGLSTLISSYEIFNLTKQIQEDHLEQLDYFTQFSLVALKEFERAQKRAESRQSLPQSSSSSSVGSVASDDSSSSAADAKDQEQKEKEQKEREDLFASVTPAMSLSELKLDTAGNMHPFQVIDFLVRDWANFEDEDDIKKCLDSMPPVLDHAMTTAESKGSTREQIKRAFENIGCFLLPHPGKDMAKPQYTGQVDVVDKAFFSLVDRYAHRVFDELLVPKRIQGRDVTPRALHRYIKAYAEVFREGKLPKTMTLVEAIGMTTNLCAKDDGLALYKEMMNKKCSGDTYVPDDELELLHATAARKALDQYDASATFGDDESIERVRNELARLIEEEFKSTVDANKNKLQGKLHYYVVPIIAAVVAWVADRATDYTCDAWSENCRSFSNLAAFFYYIVFLVLGYEFFRIYQRSGKIGAGMAAMALGKATLEKVDTLQRQLSVGKLTGSSSSTPTDGSADTGSPATATATGKGKKKRE